MSEIETTTPTPERTPAEEETAPKMHNFSAYIHIGPGSEECEHSEDGKCADREHFHAWVRLPNQFERKSISDKAIAAEARKLRAYRDAESSDSLVLDNEIDSLVTLDDREALIDEVVGSDFFQDHLRAVKEIAEEDEKEGGEWATIEEDRERLNSLRERPPEDRNEEEFEELGSRIARHAELVNDRREEIQKPRRDALKETSAADLGTMVRQLRVEVMGNGVRREEALKWEMYVCTMKPKSPDKPGFPNERAFSSIDTFVAAPSEVLEPIAETVTRLNQEAGGHLKG